MTTRLLILDYYLSGKGSTSNSLDLPAGDGSLHYEIQAEDDTVLQTLTNVGVTENPAASMVYQVSVPSAWAGQITWYADAGTTKLAAYTFDYECSAGFQGSSLLTLTFTDSHGTPVPNVTFFVHGTGVATTNASGTATINLIDGVYTISTVPAAGVMWADASVTVSGNTTTTISGTSQQQPIVPPPIPTPPGTLDIKLKRYAIAGGNHYYLKGFRLRVEVAEAHGIDPNVFLFARCPPNPITGVQYDKFMTIASFVDMADYPVGDPNPELVLPFLRKSVVELDVRSTEEYEEIWKVIRSGVCNLCVAVERADKLKFVEEVTCNGQSGIPISDSSELSDASLISESF